MPAIRIGLVVALSIALAEGAAALTIAPTFVGAGWDATRQAVVQHAIDDWQSGILDAESLAVDFEFTALGSSGPLGQWSGAYVLSGGTDVYPWTPGVDHTIQFNSDIANLWWDPTPTDAGADQPSATWDALSIALHELGHALGFIDGFYVDNFATASEFDKWALHITGAPPVFDDGGLGVDMAASNDLAHVADSGASAGDLMLPSLLADTRRNISNLDLAMLDLAYGMSVASVPEPGSGALLMTGLAVLAWRRRHRTTPLSPGGA